jgi:F-type H+-transporting ATPase subunit gamma
MPRVEAIKKEMQAVDELGTLTRVLEETAARDISQMRERILKSRPYFQEAWKIYGVLQQLAPPPPSVVHKSLVVAVTLEWGMTGSLLTHVLDKAEELYDEHEADMLLTGKMGRQRFAGRDERTIHLFSVPKKAEYNDIEAIYKIIATYAKVYIVYPRFESLSKQIVSVSTISSEQLQKKHKKGDGLDPEQFMIDPDVQSVVNYMNEVVIGLVVYNYFSEALLAYSAAQMVAMRAAHDNTKEESRHLTLRYNKARRELVDSKLRELYQSKAALDSGIKA